MINFCDKCLTIKPRNEFDAYYEYEENTCIKCATEAEPSEAELQEADILIRTLDKMMFGEEEEDCAPDEEENFVYDGEIEDDDEDDEDEEEE